VKKNNLQHKIGDLSQEKIETLLEIEKKYANLFQNANDAIFIFDVSTRNLVEVNKAGLNLTSDLANTPPQPCFEDILKFENHSFNSLINSLFAQDEKEFIIDHLLLSNQEVISVEFTVSLFGTGEQHQLQIKLRDITEQEKVQREQDRLFQLMRNSEHQYRSLFESTPIGILIVNPTSGEIIKANRAMQEILEYSSSEFTMLNLIDLFPSSLQAEYNVIMELLEKDGKLTLETERLSKSGKLVPVETSLSMTTYGEGIPVIIINLKDISEQKQSGLIRRVTFNIAKKINAVEIELSELCAFIQDELSEIMPSENFYIALDSDESLNYIYVQDQFATTKAPFYKEKENSINEFIIENKKTIRLVGPDTDEFHEKNRVNIYGIHPKSWLGAPIISGGNAVGIVAVQSYSEHFAYTESHEQLLSLLGSELGGFLERVRERQERDEILSLSRDLICIASFEGFFTYVNPAFTELLGYSKEEFLSTPFSEFIHQDDLKKSNYEIHKLTLGHLTTYFENRFITKNGDYKMLSWVATPNPENKTIYAIARDITEQQKTQHDLVLSEKKYRALFETAHDGIFIINQETKTILDSNKIACQRLGYHPSELIGKSILSLYPNSEQAFIKEKIKQLSEKGQVIFEAHQVKKNGDYLAVEISSSIYHTANKEVFQSFVRDISERKQQQEQLDSEHNQALRYQSMLLSSQLNPHFIFNSLNSIQYHILEEDPEPSLIYLSRFAKLMRSVLKNSTSDFISIQDEIDFLTVYLELEKSRHKNKFDFVIECDDELDPSEILLPPMLLQPYAENSIIHGIGHLVDEGEITVRFFEVSKKRMCCEISDNGIGRKEAQKRNILKEGEKASHSSEINKNRIDILNKIEGGGYSVKFEDLLGPTKTILGTKVIIKFPLIKEE
jgi:PAS domain S-box-containing protein